MTFSIFVGTIGFIGAIASIVSLIVYIYDRKKK